MRGRFIVVEGLDGAGISTQVRRLAAALDRHGITYECTREPTDGPIGSQIRLALRHRLSFDPFTLALMYAADRSDHIQSSLLPRLAAGVTVVSERHILSSLAYQGVQCGLDWVQAINQQNVRRLKPDLIVFLDVPPETALQRIDTRRHARELFENDQALASTRRGFLEAIEIVRREGVRVETVDATRSIDQVEADVVALVLDALGVPAAPVSSQSSTT